MEGDNDNGTLGAGYIALADDVAEVYSVPRILGAPVATGVLTPVICRLGGSPEVPVASQDVTGHVINTFITSQVSRKIGHGS